MEGQHGRIRRFAVGPLYPNISLTVCSSDFVFQKYKQDSALRVSGVLQLAKTGPLVTKNSFARGGWSRAELHYGSILQYASVYTISRAVRTSGEATEDSLKSKFLSPFRCKCWTLTVILPHNCSDYLTNTRWSLRTLKTCVFLPSSPRVKTSPRVISISPLGGCWPWI